MLRFRRADGSDYSEWGKCRLGSLLSFKNGLNIGKEKFGSGIKFISVLDILNNNYIDYNNIRGMVDIDQTLLNEFDVEYGDILFQRSSETREDAGKSNVYLDKEKKATFGGFVIRGKKIGDYIPEFMNFCLRSAGVRKQIIRKAQGEQHVNVGQDILSNIEINLPCIEEQQKIAEFLSEVDNIIAASEQEIENLELEKKGAMQKIFSQEVRFKTDAGTSYPDWEKETLKQSCEYVDYRGKTPRKTKSGIFLITAKNIRQGYIDYKISQEYISEEDYDDVMHRGYPKIGDVLITTEAPCGYVAQIDNENVALAQRVIKYRGKKEILNNTYLKYELQGNKFQTILFQKATGGTVKGIKGSVLHGLTIDIPCLEEQQKIADFLSEFDNAIEYAKEELEVWKNIKKGLLQQMFE